MTFITILIPCLIAILLFYVYRDITGKVSLTKDIGSRELQDFSDNQDAKFKALDDRFKDLKITLNERLVGIEKSIGGLQKNISKSEQRIKDIEKNEILFKDSLTLLDSIKVDKEEQMKALESITVALVPLQNEVKSLESMRTDLDALAPLREEIDTLVVMRQDLDGVSSKLQSLEKVLSQELNEFVNYIDKSKQYMETSGNDLNQLKTDVTALSNQKISQEILDLEILKAKKLYQMFLDQEIAAIEKSIDALKQKVQQLEKTAGSTTPLVPPTRSQPKNETKQTENISEQDIKE